MKSILMTTVAFAALSTAAIAGGIDRSGQSIVAIFEKGNYAELTFGSISPSVSGNAVPPYGIAASGDMAAHYLQLGTALKMDLNDRVALALIYDQPFGADVSYPTGTGYYGGGTTATLKTNALTLIGKYTLPSNVSFLAGLRYQTLEAVASVPFIGGYTVDGNRDGGLGYVVGVGYEKPEIALRVALTYNSRISHSLPTIEFGGIPSSTPVDTPQSVSLDFQTGIAKDTLLFGSVRWVEWGNFAIDPANYPPPTPLVSYAGNTTTYSLGIGRRFNENWAAAVSLGYEKPLGGFSSNLGPTDGQKSIGIGATYTMDYVKITGAVRYVDIGDANPSLGAPIASANFRNNHAIALGFKIGYSF